MAEKNMSKIAAIQLASGPVVSANLMETERLIKKAADMGAELIVLPENFALIGKSDPSQLEIMEKEGDGPIQNFLSTQAEKNNLWIVGGTIMLSCENSKKARSASLLFNSSGEQVARYDKMHLFDVTLADDDKNESYAESNIIQAGNKTVVVETPFGRLGLAICYDLRFPELFRSMIDLGAEIIALPAAFTAYTGAAHWEALVRARAIENLCYLVAAGQGGYHSSGRETHGNSMIVDPWGRVIERLQKTNDTICADISMDYLHKVRQNFPVLEHRNMHCAI
jgi:deaminated glutathione amidase